MPGLQWVWKGQCVHNLTMSGTHFFITIPTTSCHPTIGKFRFMCEETHKDQEQVSHYSIRTFIACSGHSGFGAYCNFS